MGQQLLQNLQIKAVVHFEGDLCTNLDIILLGRVALERIDAAGNVMIVGEFQRDDIFGGNLLFSRNPVYPMTVVAREATKILEIKKDALFGILSLNQEFLLTYLEFVSDNALTLGEKIKHEIKKSIRESIIEYLKTESIKQNSRSIVIKTTKKALAERIGVQRTSLSRELAKMKRCGLINISKRSIDILSAEI